MTPGGSGTRALQWSLAINGEEAFLSLNAFLEQADLQWSLAINGEEAGGSACRPRDAG